jgi:formiminotetrahydrofolate cyclodeaminase
MKPWTEADLHAFQKVIDPDDNATGGGTASAVAGVMAAGLVGMVARVSKGKPDLESDAFYDTIDTAAQELTRALMQGGKDDSEAFGAVMRSFTLPKCTEEEKQARTTTIRAAMAEATRVPLDNAQNCVRVLELADRLSAKFNQNAASDLACARSLACTGVEGCLENVAINLPSVKDEQASAELTARSNELRSVYSVLSGGTDG